MWQLKTGTTRTVLLTKKHAFKLAGNWRGLIGPWTWKRFLHGLLSNLTERQWSQLGKDCLCPVLFADPFGLLVVMPRLLDPPRQVCPVEVLWFQEVANVPTDRNPSNFGWVDGRMVLWDYGA